MYQSQGTALAEVPGRARRGSLREWATPAGLTAESEASDARAARISLADELATCTSASDLNDLDAILDRYSDAENADIRRILATRRVA